MTVNATQCLARAVVSAEVGRVVEVGKVVEEEVEGIGADEMSGNRGAVGVDRARLARSKRKRRRNALRFVEVEEEELRRATHRLEPAAAAQETRNADLVLDRAAEAGECHGRGNEPRPLERLEDRLDPRREVTAGHLDHRVAPDAQRARGEYRTRRGAVVDNAILVAIEPGDVGNPVPGRRLSGGDRREAHRRHGRKNAHGARVLGTICERREIGELARIELALEQVGG